MNDWNDLTPAEQCRVLAYRMRILRDYDQIARSNTVEALARSRELLAIPVYTLSCVSVRLGSSAKKA